MKFWKFFDSLDEKAQKQLGYGIIAAGFAVLFTLGTVTGKIISERPVILEGVIENSVEVSYASGSSDAAQSSSSSSSSSSSQDTNSGASTDSSSSQGNGASTDNSAAQDSGAATGNGQMSTAEIINLFNESANKVKTEAVKVTKNFEKRTYSEEKSEIPGALQGMANSIMGSVFKDDTDPIVYGSKEDIVANYQVPGETWSSCLTEAEVAAATCTDNGTEYEIYIKLKDSENPEAGVGAAKAVDTITASEIKENAPPILKDFTTLYYDCEIKCRIDKASGRTVWSSYTTPVLMKVNVEMFGTLAAQVGMTFEKDYTIEY